jgi:hypothetical protein
MVTKIHKKVHEGVGFEVEKINGMWTIYYDSDQIDQEVFNWEKDNDRVHVLKSVAVNKAKQYIEEL